MLLLLLTNIVMFGVIRRFDGMQVVGLGVRGQIHRRRFVAYPQSETVHIFSQVIYIWIYNKSYVLTLHFDHEGSVDWLTVCFQDGDCVNAVGRAGAARLDRTTGEPARVGYTAVWSGGL